jgi:hypothetical protein
VRDTERIESDQRQEGVSAHHADDDLARDEAQHLEYAGLTRALAVRMSANPSRTTTPVMTGDRRRTGSRPGAPLRHRASRSSRANVE